jgi:hypothetical protein
LIRFLIQLQERGDIFRTVIGRQQQRAETAQAKGLPVYFRYQAVLKDAMTFRVFPETT